MYQVRQNFIPYVFYMEFNVGDVVAYYDYQQSTIRHVKCPMRIPESSTKRCSHCKAYRVNVLHSGLSRLLKLGETQGLLLTVM